MGTPVKKNGTKKPFDSVKTIKGAHPYLGDRTAQAMQRLQKKLPPLLHKDQWTVQFYASIIRGAWYVLGRSAKSLEEDAGVTASRGTCPGIFYNAWDKIHK